MTNFVPTLFRHDYVKANSVMVSDFNNEKGKEWGLRKDVQKDKDSTASW